MCVSGVSAPSLRSAGINNIKVTGGEHGGVSIYAIMIRPECPFCLSEFASVASAVQHARNALARNYCVADSAFLKTKLATADDELECPSCEERFDNTQEYYTHAISHLHSHPSVKCYRCCVLFSCRSTYNQHICMTEYSRHPCSSAFSALVKSLACTA